MAGWGEKGGKQEGSLIPEPPSPFSAVICEHEYTHPVRLCGRRVNHSHSTMTAAGGTGAGVKGLGEKVHVGARRGPGASFPPARHTACAHLPLFTFPSCTFTVSMQSSEPLLRLSCLHLPHYKCRAKVISRMIFSHWFVPIPMVFSVHTEKNS